MPHPQKDPLRPLTDAARAAGRRSGDAAASWSRASTRPAWRP